MNVPANEVTYVIEQIVGEQFGYGVYAIDGGRFLPTAKFALADPQDGDEGYYVEAETLQELADEFVTVFDLSLDFS